MTAIDITCYKLVYLLLRSKETYEMRGCGALDVVATQDCRYTGKNPDTEVMAVAL